MMKQPKQQKPHSKFLYLALLVISCIVLLAIGAYAAYTSSKSVKRVVVARTRETNNQLRFSSNHLTAYAATSEENNYAIRPISVNSSGDVTIGITVCNYPHSDPTLVNASQIKYKMTAESVGLAGCTVTLDKGAGELQGGIKTDNLHTLTVSGIAATDFSTGYIIVVVSPQEGYEGAVDNNILAARLKIVPTAAGASAWQGEIKLNGSYKDNDAINYHIYGTEQCEMILQWNTNLIELGDWSKELLGKNTTDTSPLSISVGGPGKPTSYLLQFYRKSPAEGTSDAELNIRLSPVS